MTGHIKLHRKILEWEWWDNEATLKVFLFLLLKANWENKIWKGIEIRRGELLTSRRQLAKKLKMSEQKIRTCLANLKSTQEITQKSTQISTQGKYSIYKLNNYEIYQEITQKSTQKSTHTKEEKKKRNNIKENNIKEKFEIFWNLYPRKVGKDNAYKSWLKLSTEDQSKCIEVIPIHSKQDQWAKEKQFIPHPATWLNQGRWKDDIGSLMVKVKTYQCQSPINRNCIEITTNQDKICQKCKSLNPTP